MRRSRLLAVLLLAALAACSPEPEREPDEPDEPDEQDQQDQEEHDEEAITVVYLGDSLTAGYGLPQGEAQAYPALIQARIDSLGWRARTVNAGLSGDTSASGLRRFEWIAARQPVDVLVLALGANDGLRGLDPEALRHNLEAVIERAREANPAVRIVLAGMLVPANMGGAYGQRFSRVFEEVAEAEGAALVPFLLEGVGGVRALNQADGVHPTAEGQRVMAETVWRTLRPVLEEALAARA